MNPPLAITRCSLLTPLDTEHRSTWDAIQSGIRITLRTGVRDEHLDPDTSLDRSIRLALAVARKALPPELPDDNLHLFCGTSKGPITTWLAAADALHHNQPLSKSAAEHLMLGTGAMGAYLTDRLRLKGPAHTSVAACSSGMHALHRAACALWRGECTRALVVAADASLHPLFPASFHRLGVLAPPNDDGIRRCDPFAAEGTGFFLIEAAAAILLETVEHVSDDHGCHGSAAADPCLTDAPQHEPRTTNHGPRPLAYLTHSWIGADATDLIAIDTHTTALRHGLKKILTDRHEHECHGSAAADPCLNKHPPLAFLHAHATGTGHDVYELEALRALAGDRVPIFSHKKYLGHSLGAAGLVSVALSVACHQHHRTLDGIAITTPDSLTIAQGFGGHIGIIALRGNTNRQK